ncbi:MAG TPA: hypothetical protein VGO00_11590 [Kofleriaceae bacterium]|nr:hypothetical protein [Kofleriaceae bacterium]
MTELDDIKATVEARVDEIKSEVSSRGTAFRQRIVDNPWSLVAFGALAGAWLASHGRGRKSRGAVVGVLGTVTLRVIRDAAMYEMTKIARGWFDDPPKPTPFAH